MGSSQQDCNLNPCPIDCKWSSWGQCSPRCGPGKQTRYKLVTAEFGGNDCMGSSQKDCNLNPCPIDCKWGQWGVCTSCEQSRSKQVTAEFGGKDCFGSSQRICDQKSCPCAKYYQHSDFNGWEKVVEETNQLDLNGNENNQATSVRVKPGCTLTLFKDHNNIGLINSLTSDVSFLSHNDQVSSVSCTCDKSRCSGELIFTPHIPFRRFK